MSTLEIKSNTANNHGIKIGMGRTQNEEKKTVECGYWHLWHYNPDEDGQVLKAANTDGKEEMKVSNVIKEAFILRSLRSLSKVHWTFFTYHGPSHSLRLNPRNGDFSGLGSQVHWTCSYATPLQSAVRPRTPLKSIR